MKKREIFVFISGRSEKKTPLKLNMNNSEKKMKMVEIQIRKIFWDIYMITHCTVEINKN